MRAWPRCWRYLPRSRLWRRRAGPHGSIRLTPCGWSRPHPFERLPDAVIVAGLFHAGKFREQLAIVEDHGCLFQVEHLDYLPIKWIEPPHDPEEAAAHRAIFRRAAGGAIDAGDEVEGVDLGGTGEIPRLAVAFRAGGEVDDYRSGVGHEYEFVRRIHGPDPVGSLAGERRMKYRIGQAEFCAWTVEIRQPNHETLNAVVARIEHE